MRTILALDLGKFNTVACVYEQAGSAEPRHDFRTLATTPAALHDLIVEIGPAAGWVQDLCQALDKPMQVANPNTEAWRWKNLKRKTDQDDALKLARLSAARQLPTVTLPRSGVRQWRSLIAYRHTLIGRRTAIKNSLRAILDRQGLTYARGKSGWTVAAIASLQEVAQPLEKVSAEELWRGLL